MGLIWSLGTTNYGQIVRHHVMHDFLLLMALYMIKNINTYYQDNSAQKLVGNYDDYVQFNVVKCDFPTSTNT